LLKILTAEENEKINTGTGIAASLAILNHAIQLGTCPFNHFSFKSGKTLLRRLSPFLIPVAK
jgi:hypothetical protein